MASRTYSHDGDRLPFVRTRNAVLQSLTDVLLVLLAFIAVLTSGSYAWSATFVTVAAIGAAVRCVLRARRRGSPWLAHAAGPRVLLIAACYLLTGPGELWTTVAALLSVCAVVSEPYLRRFTQIRSPFVANLPGVRPVADMPDLAPWVFFSTLVPPVAGVWTATIAGGGAVWLALAVCALAPSAVLVFVGRQRITARDRLGHDVEAAVAKLDPHFIIYTTRPDDASYQVTMWLPFLLRSGCRFLIVTRNRVPAAALAAVCDVPIVERRRLGDLDAVVTPSTRAAFYVNASSGNGALVRYHQLVHVYLGHGDSDKPPSYNPTHAMFDKIFVAGPAAAQRYATHGVAINPKAFQIVGRPQVESVSAPAVADAPIRTVLYAPTWRGHVEETALSSLGSGAQIVSALLERGVRVIFRPHPFSYQFDEDHASIQAVHRTLEADTAKNGSRHLYGAEAETELSVVDCMNASDAMVSDVSSVVSDYLFSTKPFAMVSLSLETQEFIDHYPVARAAYVIDADLTGLDSQLDLMLGDDPLRENRSEARSFYLGDFPRDGYSDAFISAVRELASADSLVTGAGLEASDDTDVEAPPASLRVSARRLIAGVSRDALITVAALVALSAAATSHPWLAAGALTLAVLGGAWARRRILPRPRRWNRLIGSELTGRVLLAAGPAVLGAASSSWIPVATSVLLLISLLGESAVRRSRRAQGLTVSGLPGLTTAVRTVGPPGFAPVTHWIALVAGWSLGLAGVNPLVAFVIALVQFVVMGQAWVAGMLRTYLSTRAETRLRGAVTQYEPEFAVYFASAVGAAYQLGMWLPYLARLDRRFIIITRTLPMTKQIRAMVDVPVIYRPTLRSLDEVTVESLTAAFYVNNSVRNTHFIERRQLVHVWLNHGDSEKPACYNPVHAIYDLIFAAGQAGIDRYARHGVQIPREKFQIVGRPQVESITAPQERDGPLTVLYAPTWKGPFADSRVYSLPIGVPIVKALLARGVRIVFRAHPFNYLHADSSRMVREVIALLAADRAQTGLDHLWGPAAEKQLTIEECFNLSDVMVCDVSAVVSDYLQSGKPFSIVSVGRSPQQLAIDAPAAAGAYVLREDLSNLTEVLDNLLVADPLAAERARARIYYLGGFSTENYADHFLEAARRVIDRSDLQRTTLDTNASVP